MAEELGKLVTKERARLNKLRASLIAKRNDIDSQIGDVEKQISAADAYASALGGKTVRRKSKATGAPKGPRGPRKAGEPGRRDQVLDVIKAGSGLKRGEILKAMNIVEKDNPGAAQSVSNALTALKKAKTIKAEGGKYTAA